VQCPCNSLIEDCTKIFYMTDKRDSPSIQRTRSVRGSRSMRKVDGLSNILIDFYVLVLTPRLNRMETSLQLSENITLFAVCLIYAGAINKET
jgi:hypothetical protein